MKTIICYTMILNLAVAEGLFAFQIAKKKRKGILISLTISSQPGEKYLAQEEFSRFFATIHLRKNSNKLVS